MNFWKQFEKRVQTRIVQPMHLFMSVGPGSLTEEEYDEFVDAWLKLGLPHVDLGGGTVDLDVEHVIDVLENTSGIKKELGVGWKLPNKVLEEAKKTRQNLRGY